MRARGGAELSLGTDDWGFFLHRAMELGIQVAFQVGCFRQG